MANSLTYRSSRAKLEWARTQLDIVGREVADIIEQQRKVSMFHVEPETGHLRIDGQQRFELPDLLSAHIGRVIGAVRSALDNLVVETVEAADSSVKTRDITFPISGHPEKPGCEKWMAQKIGPLPSGFRRVLVELKPYKGGNERLMSLHELRNQDEHLSINIAFLNRAAKMKMSGHYMPMMIKGPDGKPRVAVASMRAPTQFNTAVTVEFGEGTTAKGKEVVPLVGSFISLGSEIVAKFEAVQFP